MIEQRTMLKEAVDKLFNDLVDTGIPELVSGSLPQGLWEPIEEMGITVLFVPENAGGFGGCWADAFVVLNLLGFYALPLPIAETMLAHKLFAGTDISLPDGPISIVPEISSGLSKRKSGEFQFNGQVSNVPWGAAVDHIVVTCHYEGRNYMVLLARSDASIVRTGQNLAYEPHNDLCFTDARVLAHTLDDSIGDLFKYCALLRITQISGALTSILRQSVEYTNERSQFGRPIARFQVIQHQLALLAGETAAVNCAAMAACRAADVGDAAFEIAAAKLRANRAIGEATSIAHQVHGAMGFTKEHRLHHATQRLISWRSEYGNDRFWATYLGEHIARRGARRLWSDLTERSDKSG